MPPKLRSKIIVESSDLGSDAIEAAQEGRVPALVEQIENLMNSLVRQQGNPCNSLIEQVEGRGAGNVDVPILFSNNSNEFQAFMQEIKSHRVVMTAIMEEMKYFREGANKAKLLLSLKENFLMNSGGGILISCGELMNFTACLCKQRSDTFLPT